jgi:hypothetical protein
MRPQGHAVVIGWRLILTEYAAQMSAMDASTDRFLERARSDLERQLAPSVRLDAMTADVTETGVSVRARVIVGDQRVVLTGSGASLTDAYEDLIEKAPPEVLAEDGDR